MRCSLEKSIKFGRNRTTEQSGESTGRSNDASERTAIKLTRWKVLALKFLVAPLACLALTVALLELSLPLLYPRFAGFFRLSLTAASLNRDNAHRFFSSDKFDPELGWDNQPTARNYVATKPYLAQAYGDSFVYGAEVGRDETWQAHFERLTGEAIVNRGVGGYGLDQAVLKFEKYARHSPTRLAILGLHRESFRRVLSYYSYYYFRSNESAFIFKPIVVKRDGQFEVLRPPCTDAVCFLEVVSNPQHEVWQWLAHYDYWYQTNKEKPVPEFPHTIAYLRVLPQILRARLRQPGMEHYFVNADALEVVKYLIEWFVHTSQDLGMTPVCVILHSPADLRVIKDGMRFDDELLQFLAARGILYVDTAPYILAQYRHDDHFQALRAPQGHLNGRGNRIVAEALAQGLASMGLLGH
jgi:hypothetical protein